MWSSGVLYVETIEKVDEELKVFTCLYLIFTCNPAFKYKLQGNTSRIWSDWANIRLQIKALQKGFGLFFL